jgi:hydrogenase expression/formation protein HypE
VLDSVKKAADACEVSVVTGDTKVVARGQCDGLYVNTAGIGELMAGYNLSPDRITGGDHLLVSGPLGDHGMAVLAAREAIRIENGPLSDSAPVHRLVMALQALAPSIRFMRDPTRGGLAAVTNEMVEERPFGLLLKETLLPFSPGARAVAELLGIDPLQVASEGRLVLVCDPAATESILALWRAMPEGRGAVRIGEVTGPAGRVVMETVTGGRRLVDVPRGELLPRIC